MSDPDPPPVVQAPTVASVTVQIRMLRIDDPLLRWFHHSFNQAYHIDLHGPTLAPLLAPTMLVFKPDAISTLRHIIISQYRSKATSSTDAALSMLQQYITDTGLLYRSPEGAFRPLRSADQLTRAATIALTKRQPLVEIALARASLFPIINNPTIDFLDFEQFTMDVGGVQGFPADNDSYQEHLPILVTRQK